MRGINLRFEGVHDIHNADYLIINEPFHCVLDSLITE